MSRISHKERERILRLGRKMTVITAGAKAHSLHRMVGASGPESQNKSLTCAHVVVEWWRMKTIDQAIKQLERSERGQQTVKLLRDFLKSAPVQGLDGSNSEAVVTLAAHYLLGSGTVACNVNDAMNELINRNQWVLK